MKIVFFGNADFGLKALDYLYDSYNHEILAVVTNQDKKSGRKQKVKSTPIKDFALNKKIKLIEQDDLLDKNFIKQLKLLKADMFLVIAYKIIPKEVYSIPKYKSINLHASLLPKYKGSTPIQRAIINNENETGLSSFYIDESVDGGEVICQERIEISSSDTFGTLWKSLFEKSGEFIAKTLKLIQNNETDLIYRDRDIKTSYAFKIDKKELLINWELDALILHNKIRAFSPYPCMYTKYDNIRVKIITSRLTDFKSNKSLPGSIIVDNNRLFVKCGDLFIQILSLQPESKKILSDKDFINGFLNKVNLIDMHAFS